MDRVDPILVVDGDADTRAMYRDALAIAGFEVVEAVDGREALVKALVHPPRLVITESRLAFIDGYALCGILRRDRATAAVPILVVTTEGHPAQIGRARMAGADVVLVKPTSIETILQETQLLLDHRHTGERGGHQGHVEIIFAVDHDETASITTSVDMPFVRPSAQIRTQRGWRRESP